MNVREHQEQDPQPTNEPLLSAEDGQAPKLRVQTHAGHFHHGV